MSMSLKTLLEEKSVSQSRLARDLALSATAINRLLRHGIWPRTDPEKVRARLEKQLAAYGLSKKESAAALAWIEAGGEAADEEVQPQQEDFKVSGKQTLSREARLKFRIAREIFSDNMTEAEDVYFDDNIRYVEQSLYATAKFGGMLALMGESGSGKSTVLEYLEARLESEGELDKIRFVRPYVVGMVSSTKKCRGMTINDICEAVLREFDNRTFNNLSAEGRFRRMHQVLQEAYPAVRCVIVIEEAHSMPRETVKLLKRLVELKKGMSRLVSVIMIGQTVEMKRLLSATDADVREVVQRTELVDLPSLADVEGYVRHRCQRAGAAFEAIFDKDVWGALRLKLTGPPEKGKKYGAPCVYPLLVGNTLTRAINKAVELGSDKVDADIIRLV